ELWPNLLREAHRSGATVAIANARLSDRSFRGYRIARPLMRRVLENVDWIFAQTERDADRFRQIGARPERVLVTGNLKFDVQPATHGAFAPLLREALAAGPHRPVLIAASTMPEEEELVLKSWAAIRSKQASALLILVPRHPPRAGQVTTLAQAAGCTVVRRTSLGAEPGEIARALAGADVLLLDSVGELAGIFAMADVVFMGGSLVPTGGHNLLEPAQAGKPVIFGPHMQNFRDAAAIFVDAGAAIQVQDWRELAKSALSLLADAGPRQAIGDAARRVVERESGATERILSHLAELLGTGPEVCKAGVQR
ncbi:MAG: 3-deoxy-D-manno-octulosonic acid transferase, partial [Terriglobia bacterium]